MDVRCPEYGQHATQPGYLPAADSRSELPTRADNADLCNLWCAAVHEYSFRALSFPEDKLPAISGITSEFQALTSDPYLAGLSGADFIRRLLWSTYPTMRLRRPGAWRAHPGPEPASTTWPNTAACPDPLPSYSLKCCPVTQRRGNFSRRWASLPRRSSHFAVRCCDPPGHSRLTSCSTKTAFPRSGAASSGGRVLSTCCRGRGTATK